MAQNGNKSSCLTVILLIFFFPFIPVYLIYQMTRRIGSSLEDYKKNSKPVKVTAYILIFCGIYYLIAGLTGSLQTDNPNDVVFGVIVMLITCCGGGIAMLVYCGKYKKPAALYNLYVPLIIDRQVTDIPQLAAMAGIDQEQTLKQLNQVIGHGALKGAYIDHSAGKILLPQPEQPVSSTQTVICPHCCGSNEVREGQHAVCEYCNMPLEIKSSPD